MISLKKKKIHPHTHTLTQTKNAYTIQFQYLFFFNKRSPNIIWKKPNSFILKTERPSSWLFCAVQIFRLKKLNSYFSHRIINSFPRI